MKRMRELITVIRKRKPDDDFFLDFEESCRANPTKKKHYRSYNEALMMLDDESWRILKEKAAQQYMNERAGQRKQGFFNQLNEALAYRYLVHKGFKNVRSIVEGERKSPDIGYDDRNTRGYCEVKTLGISDDEIDRRSGQSAHDGSVHFNLSEGFLGQLEGHVNQAWEQIHSFGENGIVFVVIRFDDIALDYYRRYRKQLIKFSRDRGFDNLYLKIGTRGNRRICIASSREG